MLEKEMSLNKTLIVVICLIFLTSFAKADSKKNIIQNLNDIQNLNFNFEQNINGKIETGNCTIEYPKKMNCKYNLSNKKKIISNGKSVVITTKSKSYYKYPIKKTPLNFILDKDFLIGEIKYLNERNIDDKFINFTIFKDNNEINLFFDKSKFNLIGWQTIDIYQNLNITYLSSIKKNQNIKKNLFELPPMN